MKTVQNIKFFTTIILLIAFIGTIFQVQAQEEKQSLSIGLTYHKTVGVESFLKISTSFKGENGWKDASNVPFEIIKIGEEEISLGKGATDIHGKAKFIIPAKSIDSTNSVELRITNHPIYEDTAEMLDFKDVNLKAILNVGDGTKQISATLLDLEGNPIIDEGLKVQVKRLIKGLPIGDGVYYTDENGMVVVDIDEDYNSFDGNLVFEVVIEEHDEYGTVRAQMHADFGIASTDLSTYDKRTLWSPAGKTPLFFLIFPNLVLLGILGIFVYLILNLIKISKS
jgi:hypothetical protein